MSDDFRPETRAWLDRTPPKDRKALGQYPTPRKLRQLLLRNVVFDFKPTTVLDPACGTGEFLADACEVWPDAHVVGWDIDMEMLDIAKEVAPGAGWLACMDATDPPFAPAWADMVIGNPPYFQTKKKPWFKDVISGRANIYSYFVKRGLNALRPGGVLAYIVPTAMNSGAYFRALRDYILDNAKILNIMSAGGGWFKGASQSVQILLLQKDAEGEKDDRFVFRHGDHMLFVRDGVPFGLQSMFDEFPTLAEYGWKVCTGSVDWSKRKDDLRTWVYRDTTPLIWASEIDGEELPWQRTAANLARPGWIVDSREPHVGPAIVVRRIIGKDGYLKASVVPAGMKFFAENHVNVVLPCRTMASENNVRDVAAALNSPNAAFVVANLIGNTQVSATELRDLIPLGG